VHALQNGDTAAILHALMQRGDMAPRLQPALRDDLQAILASLPVIAFALADLPSPQAPDPVAA
jgi:hypothetical protein